MEARAEPAAPRGAIDESPVEMFADARAARSPRVGPRDVDLHAADMAVTAGGEVTIADLSSRLADAGQWAPLEADGDLTLAEAVVHDLHGPLRLGYGGWRDILLGVQLRDGRDRLLTAGGMTVKNVAGYDLVKFAVGSHGCFGRPETITLRTYRLPEGSLAVWMGRDVASVAERVAGLLTSAAPPQWILLVPRGLRAGWLGREGELRKLAEVIEGVIGMAPETRSLEEDARERLGALRAAGVGQRGETWARVTLPPREIVRFVDELPEICRERWAADVASGTVWVSELGRGGRLATLADDLGGHTTLLSRRVNEWSVRVSGVNEGSMSLLARLKEAFDPEGRLPAMPME